MAAWLPQSCFTGSLKRMLEAFIQDTKPELSQAEVKDNGRMVTACTVHPIECHLYHFAYCVVAHGRRNSGCFTAPKSTDVPPQYICVAV